MNRPVGIAVMMMFALAACSKESNTITGLDAAAVVTEASAANGSAEVQDDGSGAGRGRRRPSVPKPLLQYEGLVTAAAADSLTVLDSHGSEVTFVVNAQTVVRHGHTAVLPEDLKAGDRVHVKAMPMNDTKVAVEVMLQNRAGEDDDGEDDGPGKVGKTMTANGEVLSAGADQLVVRSVPKGEVTVKTDAATIIKERGQRIRLSDIEPGDEVNCRGKRVDDHTLLAEQIIVRGN